MDLCKDECDANSACTYITYKAADSPDNSGETWCLLWSKPSCKILSSDDDKLGDGYYNKNYKTFKRPPSMICTLFIDIVLLLSIL